MLVAWQVAVSSVVNVLSNSKDKWVIELVKSIGVKDLNVFNAITVSVSDSSSVPSFAFLGGLHSKEVQVLWALNVVDKESEAPLILHLHILGITHAVRHFELNVIFLAQGLRVQLSLRQRLWWLRHVRLLYFNLGCLNLWLLLLLFWDRNWLLHWRFWRWSWSLSWSWGWNWGWFWHHNHLWLGSFF